MKSFSNDIPDGSKVKLLEYAVDNLETKLQEMHKNFVTAILFAIFGICIGTAGLAYALWVAERTSHFAEQTRDRLTQLEHKE